MAGLQKVFTSADLGNGLCLSKISEPLSHPPHKQNRQPGLMFSTGPDRWFRSSDGLGITSRNRPNVGMDANLNLSGSWFYKRLLRLVL